MEKQWKQWQTLFLAVPKSLQMVTAAMKLEDASWEESYGKPRQHIKKERHHLPNKCPYSQSYGFSSSHLWLWELDHKESWVPKNWCFLTVVLEKTLESPLRDSKEIKPVNKGNQPWIFHWKDWCWSWSSNILATWCEELTHWKRPWCWERLKPGGEGGNRGCDSWMASSTRWTWVWANSGRWWRKGSPVSCSPLGCKELDMIERLNHNDIMRVSQVA